MSGQEDRRHMRRALALAARGKGATSPNPPVGAVIAGSGGIAGEGYHQRAGGAHAEVLALEAAGSRAKGATLYVTLEPCNHQGRTGPCTDRILKSGVSRVVIARKDTNPHVKGDGIKKLRDGGLSVDVGVLEEQAKTMLEAYEKHVMRGLPFVVLKVAATADGRIATRTGESKWITGSEARKIVHRMRRDSDAVLVGKGTVETDDPSLDVREVPSRGRMPVRIILDSRATLSPRHRIFNDGGATILVTTADADLERREILEGLGVEVLSAPAVDGVVDLAWLLKELGARGMLQVLVEGGSRVFTAFLAAGQSDKLVLFVAPRVFGEGSLSWADELGVVVPEESPRFRWRTAKKVGEDIMLTGYWGRK